MATVISVPIVPKKQEVEPAVEPEIEEPVEVEPEPQEEESTPQPDTENKPSSGVNLYTPENTAQAAIPLRFRVTAIILAIIVVLSGIYLSMRTTEVPVTIVPITVESSEAGDSILVKLNDRVHSRVDIYKDNVLLECKGVETASGLVFNNLDAGVYLVHAMNVKTSSITYGMCNVNLLTVSKFAELTSVLHEAIAKIPDEGNKHEILADLYNNFDEVSNAPKDSDIEALMRSSNAKTRAILGFDGESKFNDESPWYNIFSQTGVLSTYLKERHIMITRENFKQIYRAIANGMKE